MLATPTAEVVRQRPWRIGLAVVVVALLFAFSGVLRELLTLWTTKADYSHGLLIVPFVIYLLVTRRELFPAQIAWPDPWSLPLFAGSAAVYFVAERTNVAKEWLQAFALVLAAAGVAVMFCGGWRSLKWAWPAFVFFPLAFPLPDRVGAMVTGKLQSFAVKWGNYGFQTLGLPSYAEGNVIVLPHADGETRLGVAQACSGLSMLLAFVTLSAAIAFLYKSRPAVDRAILFASAFPISLLCNMLRIVATGLVYYAGWTRLGDFVVHDLAGWLMMPLALLFLWLELKVMDWVTEPVVRVSTNELLGLGGRESRRTHRPSPGGAGAFNPLKPLTAGGPGSGPNPLRPEPRADAGSPS